MTVFAFYLFALCTIVGGLFTVISRNPVHSVLWLILAFLSSAGLFVLLGAEFVAMLLVIVYVGAVAVLFLFVVMMLDVNFVELRRGVKRYVYLGATLGGILFLELALVATSWTLGPQMSSITLGPVVGTVSNTRSIGQVIYTDYVYLFQGASLILLVAMVGAIVLTLRSRAGVKKQVIADQVSRSSKDELIVVKVDSGSGI